MVAHSAGLHRDAEAVVGLIGLLKNAESPVRRAVAEALGRIGSAKAVAPLLALANEPMDRALEHSVTFALIEIAQPDALSLSRLAGQPGALCVALVALDQMEGGNLSAADVLPLLQSREAALRKTAEWISDRHPEWGDALAEHYTGELRNIKTTAQSHALAARLAKLATAPAIQAVLTRGLIDVSRGKAERMTVLAAMASAPVNPVPDDWLDAIDSTAEPLQHAAVQALVSLRLAKTQRQRVATTLRRFGRSATLSDRQRTLAYYGISDGLLIPDEREYGYLLGQLSAGRAFTQRSNAAKALAVARLTESQLGRLANQLGSLGAAKGHRGFW